MKRHIGTFHKTGTMLFNSVLLSARNQGLIKVWLMHEGPEPPEWDIRFDYFTNSLLEEFVENIITDRYVICVRDPRDLIVSAAYYHCKSDEPWLHEPSPILGGLTYQQKILSLANMQERFIFEMQNTAAWHIEDMLKIPQGKNNLLLTRLETLVQDSSLREWRSIFTFLGLDNDVIGSLLKIAENNSLFSGKVVAPVHIRSGAPRQWVTEFSRETLAIYRSIFSNAASDLGYSEH